MTTLSIEEFDRSLKELAQDLSEATNRYFERERINFASAIGVVEQTKAALCNIALKRATPPERVSHLGKKPDYIG